MAKLGVAMEVGGDGVAVITIFNPPVNALTLVIYDDLKKAYAEAMRREDVVAVVLTGEAGKFSGGFDIKAFEQLQIDKMKSSSNVSVELLVNAVEDAKKPSVAAIQGLALGGGLELAMCCHARISTPDAQLGLPELAIGIIPGLGGTQRLPRLVGLSKAIEMMLLSKSISAKEGNELGLIDSVVSHEELLQVSQQWAVDIALRRKPRISSLRRTDRIGYLSDAHEMIKAARQEAKRVAPNMPQHCACLDAIEEGIIWGGYAGVLKEAKLSQKLRLSSTSKALMHLFFAQRATSKVPSVTDIGLKPRNIKKVGVIGGGSLGSGIATTLLRSGIPVILKDIDSSYLQKGLKMIEVNLGGLVKKGVMTQDNMYKALSLLNGVLDYSEFKHVDMVIEVVTEKASLKQSVFSEIEKACPPHCILVTSTSAIDLNLVGAKTSSQDRILCAQFFSPAHVMPLLEIVRTEKTSPQVILDLMTVAKIIGKVPVVENCTGFAVNRIFFPYIQGAHLLVNLGVDVFRIDRVISSFGMPLGPFQLQDLTGYGVALGVEEELTAASRGRTFAASLVELMVESGRNGKNSGKGYYIYEKSSKPRPDPSVLPIVEESRRRSNIMHGGKPITISDQEILEMIFFPVVNEACRVMGEGIVTRASDLDIASVLGRGFPNYRGGIVFWADSIGPGYIYPCLCKWAETYGNFFKPSSYLEERARKGIPLHDFPYAIARFNGPVVIEMRRVNIIPIVHPCRAL